MTNSNYAKLVERYLDGEMSQSEMAAFEEMKAQDPLLSNEYNIQKETVDGIKNFRKAELKMRLDSIDITPGLFQTIAGSTAMQATSVALLTGAVFMGSYLWVEDSSVIETLDLDLQSKTTELTESKFDQEIASELPLVEIPNFDTSNESEVIGNIEIEDTVEPVVEAPITPNFVAPQVVDAGSDESTSPEVSDAIEIPIAESNTNQQVEIENISSTRKKFQYKFFNNKLFLYGDFNGIPYEILEINRRSGKKLFLFHNSQFYRIHENVSKPEPLQLVTDNDLIKELMILKENKSE